VSKLPNDSCLPLFKWCDFSLAVLLLSTTNYAGSVLI
jgi:hypothetical protein